MTTFTVYPAIDLRHGRVVRLEYGDPGRQTIFSGDPVSVARSWIDQGAAWLHVVNLDGAFDEAGRENWDLLPRLATMGVKVQFGGGLRHMDDVKRAMDLGVARLILGTAAVKNPELVAQSLGQYGAEKVAAGLDAKDGQIKIRGWRSDAVRGVLELAHQLAGLGVRTAVHTDIARDGVLAGVNVAASANLARNSGLDVIASGGAASLEDIRQAKAANADGLTGIIIGRALYDGRIDLVQAIAVAEEESL